MAHLSRLFLCIIISLFIQLLIGCYSMRPSRGAGQTEFNPPRKLDAAAIVVPSGYDIELIASGLTFPVGAVVDDQGRLFVVESGYSYGEVFTEPRLLRVEPDGSTTTIASGGRGGPWTGVDFADGNFYIADGNVLEGGRIIRVSGDGTIEAIVTGLPSFGDHHTNGPAVSEDGWVYFGQGTATNSGVAGPDNADFGWLKRRPGFHDRPGGDITLAGINFESADALAEGSRQTRMTGAYLPYGTRSEAGQVIQGEVKCTGAILRVRAEGGEPELVAWGLRNPFGMAFAPDGKLYATENGYDERGSRPVWGAPDVLWRIEAGAWYGWPDYVAGRPITDDGFRPPGGEPLRFLLASHPGTPPKPRALFAVHSSADGLDFSFSNQFGFEGEAFVAIFGDQAPTVGKVLAPVGGKVVRVDPDTGAIHDFAVNRGPQDGPASRVGGSGFERPVAVRFDPSGESLYIVDFGVMLMNKDGAHPKTGTGALWRVRNPGSI